MMKHEFEQIAGYEVSAEDYRNILEPMYMALPDSFTKADFVKMVDRKRFALPTKSDIVKDMKRRAQFLFDNCGLRGWNDEKRELERIAKAYAKRFYGWDFSDLTTHCFFTHKYAYCGCVMDRGCSFPNELVIGYDVNGRFEVAERIALVKGVA